jgi:predicted TIM-barrel fold metal-dependent hydrolase
MIVDALVYAGPCLFGGGRSLAELLDDAAANGVDRVCVAPAKPVDYDLAAASERLAEECATSAGRAGCLVRVDPWQPSAEADAARLLELPGTCGLLVHPWEETVPANHPRVRAVARVADAAGVPIVVETGWPFLAEALSVADLARTLDVPVVMTRGGQLNMAGLAQQSADLALQSADNLRALTCGVYRQDWIERAIEAFGPERIMHASSAPVFDLGFELERLRRAEISDHDRRVAMGPAAAALFALEVKA